ncbi:MAG TPA: penicillin-binding protein 1A [Stellaceae bacterium]|nr:penicillin-binding protein 1A [Stellaceae bacterium]
MRILKFLFGLGLGLGLLGAAFFALTLWYFNRDLPDYSQLADYQPPIVTRVMASDGRLMAEYATEKRVFVPVKSMPPLLIKAFLAAEDKNFYSHPGIDLMSVIRAAVTDVARLHQNRRPVGASTITQQVAKNFLLGNEISLSRKIKEALLALKMERALSKDRILELYMNEIYLGGGNYGVAAAALNYFDKSLDELTVGEAAFLAALPKAPNNYNPDRHPEAAKERRDWVLDRMVEAGFITPAEAQEAKAERIAIRKRDETQLVRADYFSEEVRRQLLAQYGDKELYQGGLSVRTSLDPQYQLLADQALKHGLVSYDRRHGYRGAIDHLQVDLGADWGKRLAAMGLPAGAAEMGWRLAVVISVDADGATIGLTDQTTGRIPFSELKWARKPLEDARVGNPPRNPAEVLSADDVILVEPVKAEVVPPKPTNSRAPAPAPQPAPQPALPLFGLRQIPAISGAIIVMDPHTGRVLAMSGGFSYEISQFNRATQARRQTGSAIKPFVYMAALDHGFTPSSIVEDAPLSVDQGPGLPPWTPSNYTHEFYGPLPLRVGIEQSRNLITARLGIAVGLEPVAHVIEGFGIMDHMPREYSMFLGAGETTVLRLTTAYAMIVNGGKRITPSFVDRVQDRNGATIFRADKRNCSNCTDVEWTGQAAPALPDTREQVIDPLTAYQMVHMLEGVIERGTGRSILSLNRVLAGKTGTSNDSNDTWFVGFSPDLVAGVFMGMDQPQSLGGHETGASVAAPVFKEFMGAALTGVPNTPFRIPPGIRMVRVNAATGQPAKPGDKPVIYEAFKPGTEPTGDEPVPVIGAVTDPDSEAPGDAPSVSVAGGSSSAPGTPGVPATSAPQPRPPAGSAPAGGTGGLY